MQYKRFIQFVIILALGILLLPACAGFGAAQQRLAASTPTPPLPPDCVPPVGDISYNSTEFLAQEEAVFVTDVSGDGVRVLWTAVSGTFTNPEAKIAAYIAPDNVTEDTITLTISSACGDLEKTLALTIIPSTATPTANPSPTNTIAPTTTPSQTPAPTATPTSTRTPVRGTAAPTATEALSAIPPINLAEPKDNTCVGGGSDVTFQWEWDWALNNIEGPGGDYFALNIWSNSTENRSATWVKTSYYIINRPEDPIVVYTQNVDCTQEGGCFWNVDVIRAKVPAGQGYLPNSHTVIAKSPIRNFCVHSDGIIPIVPPTDTPDAPEPTPEPTLADP